MFVIFIVGNFWVYLCENLTYVNIHCKFSYHFKFKSLVKSNPITCEVCKYAMSYLDSMLVKNSTEEDVKKALDSLCAKLPSSMSSEVSII